MGRLISFGRIARKWLLCLYGIARKNITGIGRGGACVPARVALQGRIHRSFPTQCVYFCMETPLRGRSGGHTGTAPTVSFGWIACGWLMSFGQVARGMGDFVWGGLHVGGFVCWENGVHEPTPPVLYF